MLSLRNIGLLLFSFAGLAGLASASAAEPTPAVTIRIEKSGGGIGVTVSSGGRRKTFALDAASLRDLTRVYTTVECQDPRNCEAGEPWKTPAELEQSLKDQGAKFFGPMAQEIREGGAIGFKVEPSLLQLPFDALYSDGKPLFVQKPVFFTVDDAAHEAKPVPLKDARGILVSDETADPERGVFAVSKLYPKAKTFDIAEFSFKTLAGLEPQDFILISAHSSTGNGPEDYIGIADGQMLTAANLARLKPTLVYFDSCKLGTSQAFLTAFKEAGAKVLFAPALSNEAGSSSTRTIAAVFDNLSKGADPVTALFRARTGLYETHHADELPKLLWRAFPFRVYLLNQ